MLQLISRAAALYPLLSALCLHPYIFSPFRTFTKSSFKVLYVKLGLPVVEELIKYKWGRGISGTTQNAANISRFIAKNARKLAQLCIFNRRNTCWSRLLIKFLRYFVSLSLEFYLYCDSTDSETFIFYIFLKAFHACLLRQSRKKWNYIY